MSDEKKTIGLAVIGCGTIGRIRAEFARDYPGIAASFNDRDGKALVFQLDHRAWKPAMQALGFWETMEERGASDHGQRPEMRFPHELTGERVHERGDVCLHPPEVDDDLVVQRLRLPLDERGFRAQNLKVF